MGLEITSSFASSIFAIAAGDDNYKVFIYDALNGKQLNSFPIDYDWGGRRIALSPNGKFCATGAFKRRGVSLYNSLTGKLLWQRKDLKKVQNLLFDPISNDLIAGLDQKLCHILNSKTGKTKERLRSVCMKYPSPDGFYVFGKKDILEIYGPKNKKICVIKSGSVLPVVFGPKMLYILKIICRNEGEENEKTYGIYRAFSLFPRLTQCWKKELADYPLTIANNYAKDLLLTIQRKEGEIGQGWLDYKLIVLRTKDGSILHEQRIEHFQDTALLPKAKLLIGALQPNQISIYTLSQIPVKVIRELKLGT